MEIATMVGGAILGPLFQSLLDSYKSSDLFTYARGSKVLEEVRKWEPMLRTIFEVLEDAEEQQMTNGKARSWFNDLRDLAYEVDDTLDELITHVRQHKFHAETSSSKVRKLLRTGLNLSTRVKFSSDMVSNVKKISEKFETVKAQLDLSKNVDGRNNRVKEDTLARPLLTTSLAEPKVFGRKDDHKAILDMMKAEAGGRGVSVIAIVGMGGVGKTTLAQMVYNDESLQFDFKAWSSIGEAFDHITVTKTLVQSEDGDLNSLQLKLGEKLSGKKFLVVLDDLWSVDYNEWTRFYNLFASGAPGSIIIITTRSNKVSSATSSGDGYPLSYHLEVLSDDDCLSLLAHHALNQEDFSRHMNLKEVGQEIAKKCKGLPLAAKALGGTLQRNLNWYYWKRLLEHKLWKEDNSIMTPLRLSYYFLPPPLRRCFAYCAIFPKECEFDRESLVLLWLAEGFLPNLSEGYVYFDEIFARSLFQKSAKDTSVFGMHDLYHDLARSISEGACLNLDEESSSRVSYANEVRHSAFGRGELDVAPRFKSFESMMCLRTILALPLYKERDDGNTCFISSNVLDVWIPRLKCLRVLSLSGYKRVEVPQSIGVLQHLRYLNLYRAEIVTLPESVCKLFNLQVLILRNCKNLRRLPEDLCNLINLQCLDLKDTDSLEGMPLHIGNLSELQILNKFIVGSGDGSRINELLKIRNLQGEVHVKELQNVANMDYGDCLTMKEKEKVEGLVLEWGNNFDVYRDKENEEKVMRALQPHKNIARVSIKSYGGIEFPSWFGNTSFNLTCLEMCNCRNVSSLPPLGGMASLKELSIEGMGGVKEAGVEFYGVVSSSSCSNVFPSLEILNFKDMENWEIWSCFNNVEYEGQVFPKLRKLGIRSCPELVGDIPKRLYSLEELVIDGCDKVQHLWESGSEVERLGCLKELKISNCSKLVSLVKGEEGIFPPNLQVLGISSCENLRRLPNQLHNLKSLTSLEFFGCPKLETIGDLPDNVKEVKILYCDSLERLPEGIMVDQNGKSRRGQASGIEALLFRGVESDSPIVLSDEVFPASLRFLFINEGLETQLSRSLQLQNHFSHLIGLNLEVSLKSFPATGLTIPTLQFLSFKRCGNLRRLPGNMHTLTSLLLLSLDECPEIECFPEGGMPPNLSSLTLENCGKLKSLPCDMHGHTSLHTLKLVKCGKVESFPQRGWPTSLSVLEISFCDSLERYPFSEWRLNESRLKVVRICGAMEMVTSFPHDSLPLPTSLTELYISHFENLKSISSGLQKLTSLEHLFIVGCIQLQNLPKEGLPPSLGRLCILVCPLLEKQCRTGEGKYWSHLSHIPDYRFISNPYLLEA